MERTLDAEPAFAAFRARAREFCEDYLQPRHAGWEQQGFVDHEAFSEAARRGLYCMGVPCEFGGAGLSDYRYNMIMNEECQRANVDGFLGILGSDMVLPYFLKFASADQKRRWLPRVARGEGVLAVAMSEPDIGSDVAAVATTATLSADGSSYLVNGSKMWISNGSICDLLVLVVRTNSTKGHRGLSLLVVERRDFSCEILPKVAFAARDVCHLEFKDVVVPAANLLGEEGQGFRYLMSGLQQERLTVAVSAVAAMSTALDQTIAYTRERRVFGRAVSDFQHNSFLLASLATRVAVTREFVDRCVMEHVQGKLSSEAASMAKLWATEQQLEVLSACVQLHGAYGLLATNDHGLGGESLRTVHPIAKQFVNARVQPIYAGSNEIMKEIIAKGMGLARSRL